MIQSPLANWPSVTLPIKLTADLDPLKKWNLAFGSRRFFAHFRVKREPLGDPQPLSV